MQSEEIEKRKLIKDLFDRINAKELLEPTIIKLVKENNDYNKYGELWDITKCKKN